MRVNEYLEVAEEGGNPFIRCRCGYRVCAADENFKAHVLMIESPLHKAGPLADVYSEGEMFVFREFCCPGCATLLATEVALRGDPILWDIQLEVPGGRV
ncbi:MAG TPA: acetone carboxylase subunit gamma [Dehalococcoidia bacterium]|nr:acetone carboxylase subunit gamma [Dehalococcoidia bacterium]HLB28851.1 acetone carboxylase subunit gamma [Dehalococcoidia bacterium]